MSNLQFSIFNYQLNFKSPAGTSRGVYTKRQVWYVVLTSKDSPEKWGVGECAPLPGLSCDDLPDYEALLTDTCRRIERTGVLDIEALRPYPSMLFGLETAFRQFKTGSLALWDTAFSKGEKGIPINGLIWMGEYDKMLEQIEAKLQAGFRCIKLKIGAIRFEEEFMLLRHIRNRFPVKDIELRVDANGAFSPDDALDKLSRLAELNLHSIEQPIRAGQWAEMAKLTNRTPIPIALDEELIGCNTIDRKKELLDTIQPQYIILKPSLHGGMSGCEEWIEEASKRQIGWWVTSALESNIGLNAIAQWHAAEASPHETSPLTPLHKRGEAIQLPIYQGLGTGGLFTNNVEMPLEIRGDELWFTSLSPQPPLHKRGGGIKPGGKASPPFRGLGGRLLGGEVQTSGSTGKPKLIEVEKEKMFFSARQTCAFLNLKKGDTALLCMDLRYIGAKMMVVRAIVCGLNLIVREASGNPLKEIDATIDFAAMVPLQVYNTLQVPEERERLAKIKSLIIGGGSIDSVMEKELQAFPNKIYSTYGMTETLSHIALRRISGEDASLYYTPFPSVKLSLSPEGTLIIDVPDICDKPIATNDMAELLPDGRFRIIGRKDNIINTGGIKIQAEAIEDKLKAVLPVPFAITSAPDPKFGEAIVLLIEGNPDVEQIRQQLTLLLSKHECPKHIFPIQAIPLTENGKINRKACKNIARNKEY